MDKNVGQITLYNYNYGSALQCYATQQLVNTLGYNCVLFRLAKGGKIKRKISCALKVAFGMARYPGYGIEFIRMIKGERKSALTALTDQDFQGIQKFIEEDICFKELTIKQMKKAAHSDEYFAFLSGSDQIWNGSRFPQNDAYFLRFAPLKKRIAWAPSFGTDTIAPYNQKKFQKYIGEYHCLSARETRGVDIIKKLTGNKAVQVADPVLLISAEKWREEYTRKHICPTLKKYVFCYFLNVPSKAAMEYLKKCSAEGLSIVAFASNYDCLKAFKNIHFKGGSPWNYLAYLDRAAAVCSDSFHALAFSLLFHKDMRIFRRNYLHGSDQSERIKSLFTQVNLSDRFIEDSELLPGEKLPVNYDSVDHILKKEEIKAKAYLKGALTC